MEALVQDFKKLKVWNKVHQLTLHVNAISQGFPKDELFGLTSQIRRSAASIPTNIAEGCGRNGEAELARYLQFAAGSASELEYQLILARDLHYISEKEYPQGMDELIEVKRMLSGLSRKVRPAPAENQKVTP
jgi:four helix bundle protein